jgi:ABC-type amino acid transport substrate-binding protein
MFAVALIATATAALRVGFVADQYPCSYQQQNIWRGSAIETWGAVAERTHLPFVIQKIKDPKQAIELLANNKLDVAVSCLNLTHERLTKVGYTAPYKFEGIKILSKAREIDLTGVIVFLTKEAGLPQAFLLLFGTTLVITLIAVLLDKKLIEAVFSEGYSTRSFIRFWLLMTIGGSLLDKSPRLKTATLVTISHYIRIIFTGALIGAITAAAVGDARETEGKFNITGFRDLRGLRIGVREGTYAENVIRHEMENGGKTSDSTKIFTYKRIDDLEDALNKGLVDVIADDTSSIEVLAEKYNDTGNYFVYPPELAKTPQGFLTSPKLPKKIDNGLDDAVVSILVEGTPEASKGLAQNLQAPELGKK